MQDARQVQEGLEEIAAHLLFAGESRFKIDAYRTAAEVVQTVGSELGARIEQDRLRELSGIGAATSRQIQELWNSGTSQLLERLRAAHPTGAAELIRVPGMTPRRIRALHEALGVTSLAELLAACRAGRVRDVTGFGQKTEEKLLQLAERYLARKPPPPTRLLLSEALGLFGALQSDLGEQGAKLLPAGALRRGEELIDELTGLVVGELAPVLERLASMRRVLRIDPEAGVVFLSDGVRLQLTAVDPGRLGEGWVRATGNAAHLCALQQRAAARGVKDELAFTSEAALYGALGLPWVPPELRQGADELAVALAPGFDDLIEVRDILGCVHCHTTFSDGRASVLEMAQAAQDLGLQYITITDHSPSAHYASGVPLERLEQQWDEIDAAQEQLSIRILRGTESDILSDGSLDYPDDVLERFDVIIASIHARHRQDRGNMTARLVRALSLPVFKIWGHALGRILGQRDAIDCDVPAVLDALAVSPGAVELNADPHRLDLPAAWIPAARERGIPFVISVDAHSPRGLAAVVHGVTQARRGGLRRGEVLNTLDAHSFAQRVKPLRPST